MTQTVEKITYTPYRGEIEPIKKVRAAEIRLFEGYIELIASYDFTPFMPDEDSADFVKSAVMFPKSSVSVEITQSWHEKDPNKTTQPLVRVMCGDWTEHIHLQTEKEAYNIYTQIKNWLLK